MPRGGPRQGRPGVSYTNRSDLAAGPRVASGVASPPVYGEKVAQADQQRALPMAQAAPMPAVTPLGAPSERPSEPVTAGLPIGAGPNSLAMVPSDDLLATLRAAYDAYPSSDLLRLILDEEERSGGE